MAIAPVPAPPPITWKAFLNKARQITPQSVIPPTTGPGADTWQPAPSVPLKQAVLLVPKPLSAGVGLAVADLKAYLEKVTGQPVATLSVDPGVPLDLAQVPAGATAIAIGQGAPATGTLPPLTGQPGGYALSVARKTQGERSAVVVGINGDDLLGAQYGIYRLMTLTGQRFFQYDDPYTPSVGKATVPVPGFQERHAPPANMQVRGFAPHEYHPTPLSLAFHQPSPEHLAEIERYLDWCVQNGQNEVKFELLDLDARNRFLPSTLDHVRFHAWLPYARQIVDYAHERGLKVSVNAAFANDVSNNVHAIDPLKAAWQAYRLDGARGRAQKETDPARKAQALADYRKRLDADTAEDARDLDSFVDRLMQVPWDDVSWCLGSSEFSTTQDDLTVRWMNEAAAHLKQKYPGTTTTVISHVPTQPVTSSGIPYFDLAEKADKAVGEVVHTTEIYSFTDPAPVYGNQNFEHKLEQLFKADPARRTVYEPETSYWVAYDVSVPLFLPIYMLSRARDMATIRDLPNIQGQETFTTAWEWGYWLSDYAVAKMQTDPQANLTGILQEAFQPFGEARQPAVDLMRDAMLSQQRYLIDQGLIRDLQGWDTLTEAGGALTRVPGLNRLLHGTNSAPVRLRPAEIMKMSAQQLDALDRGELAQLRQMSTEFQGFADRAKALQAQVPAESRRYYDELLDGFTVNALRSREVLAALTAAVDARRAELTRDPAWKQKGIAEVGQARAAMDQAMGVIQERESHYRTAPAETYGKAKGPTMWNDRYLTPVHTGQYWKNTFNEVAKLLGLKPAN
jgi:hypothetical protein